MVDLSASEKIDIRDRHCFFRTTSEIPGYGRFYSADPRFPCSIAVPGKPRFVYHHWDSEFLLLTFNITSDEDVAVFRLDLKPLSKGDPLAWRVVHEGADVISYEEQRERESFLAGAVPKARIRRGNALVPNFTAHRAIYDNGWQRVFFIDSDFRIWSIHNRGIEAKKFDQICSSFRLLPSDFFANLK